MTAFLAGVDYIYFVASGAGRDGYGILTRGELAVQAEVHHVKDGDRAAAAVCDVGVFTVVGRVLREVVGAAGGEGER